MSQHTKSKKQGSSSYFAHVLEIVSDMNPDDATALLNQALEAVSRSAEEARLAYREQLAQEISEAD